MECTSGNPCEKCRDEGYRPTAKVIGIPSWEQVAMDALTKLKIQAKTVFEQGMTIKRQSAMLMDKNQEIDRLVKRNGELVDTLKSASKYLATMPASATAIVPNVPDYHACITFCREVMVAKDKLMMTKIKV